MGLPAGPLEAPRGPPGVRGPQVENPWIRVQVRVRVGVSLGHVCTETS